MRRRAEPVWSIATWLNCRTRSAARRSFALDEREGLPDALREALERPLAELTAGGLREERAAGLDRERRGGERDPEGGVDLMGDPGDAATEGGHPLLPHRLRTLAAVRAHADCSTNRFAVVAREGHAGDDASG